MATLTYVGILCAAILITMIGIRQYSIFAFRKRIKNGEINMRCAYLKDGHRLYGYVKAYDVDRNAVHIKNDYGNRTMRMIKHVYCL